MKRIFPPALIFLVFLIPSFLAGQWIRTYGGSGHEHCHLIRETGDGGCIAAGTVRSPGSEFDIWVLKLDPNGVIDWEKIYRGNANFSLLSIEETGDGGYALLGLTVGGYWRPPDVWVLRLDSSGGVIAESSFGRDIVYTVHSARRTDDGGMVITGTWSWGPEEKDIMAVKLGSSGDVEWQRKYGSGANIEEGYCILQAEDGGYVIAGSRLSGYSSDVLVLKLTSSGEMEWSRTYAGMSDKTPQSILQAGDGGFILAGRMDFPSEPERKDIWILRLTSSGEILWQRTMGGSKKDVPLSIQETHDGGCVLAGTTRSFGQGEDDIWLLKFDPWGNLEWQKTCGTSFSEEVLAVHQEKSGGYLVAGSIRVFCTGGSDFLLLKLLPDGTTAAACQFIEESAAEALDAHFLSRQTTDLITEEISVVYGLQLLDFAIDFNDVAGYELCSENPLLSVLSSEGGTTDPSPGTSIHERGGEVSITALPENRYRFSGWSGDVSGSENPIEVKLDSDTCLMANFIRQYELTISAGEGGTTDPEPGTYTGDSGTSLTIRAVPEKGYEFREWSGNVVSTSNPLTLSFSVDRHIRANFAPVMIEENDLFRFYCFVATAVYGSPHHPFVEVLRDFRGRYLMTNRPGRWLMKCYYRYSPQAAEVISRHRVIKAGVRLHLLPVVALSFILVHPGPYGISFLFVLIFSLFNLFLIIIRKHRD